MNQRILKLGTRRSLLAWAQSSWVAREVERLNPGVRVELLGIDTRGDKIVDISLRNVVGKEFFVAELDEALRDGRADFSVHSMKDLSLDRPEDFVLGAIPKRENSRDVVLFSPRVLERIRAGQKLRIGTSSPRRLENLPAFLSKALPRLGGHSAQLDFVEIRGNVNTRLSRVHEDLQSDRYLDGVVLAFAGLIRLWADEAGRTELRNLLTGVRWMVPPLKQNPTAPAQGALAVECRRDDLEVCKILAKLHHEATAHQVATERQILADWGGGCHQRFGASALSHPELGDLLMIRGAKSSGEFVEELRWKVPASIGLLAESEIWDSSQARSEGDLIPLPTDLKKTSAVFVAHSRGWTLDAARVFGLESRVWVSGATSWFKLAEQGVWVEGCAENFGFEFLQPILAEGVLQLPAWGTDWTVLTHQAAATDWAHTSDLQVGATYRLPEVTEKSVDFSAVKAVYWSSGSAYDRFAKGLPSGVHHACGPGKTASHLREKRVNPAVFPSVKEWKTWLSGAK